MFAKLKQCDDPFKQFDHYNSSNLQEITGICPTQKLRMCLITLKMVRDLTVHLTKKKCEEINKGRYLEDEFFKSWKEIRDTVSYALSYVLNYLKQNGCITTDDFKTNMSTLRDNLYPPFAISQMTKDYKKKHQKSKVLDAATGTGYHSVKLLKAGFDVTSVDGSPVMLSKAFENARKYQFILKVHNFK